MSESSFKNNNAYFVKEGLLIILIGTIMCLLSGCQGFNISGTFLLIASIVFSMIGRLHSWLQANYMYKYFQKNNIQEIAKNVHWDEKDYDDNYCKEARKISRSELKKKPQYYPYFYFCMERRKEFDSYFWASIGILFFFLSMYVFSRSCIIILMAILFGCGILRISNPKRCFKTDDSQSLHSQHFSLWEKRKRYTDYYMTVFFLVLFCLMSIIATNFPVDTQNDITFITYLGTFYNKYQVPIIGISIIQIIRGIYKTYMIFLSDPPDSGLKGIFLMANWSIFLFLMKASALYVGNM